MIASDMKHKIFLKNILKIILFFLINPVYEGSILSSSPSFKIGQPKELHSDTPGPPLHSKDFQRAAVVRFDDVPIPENGVPDPVELAGLFQGDIILSIEEYKEITSKEKKTLTQLLRNAIVNKEKRWPKAEIPYLISSVYNDEERAMIAAAIISLQNKTCLKFIPRDTQMDYIHILKGDGCSSSVGKFGGPQALSLGRGCFYPGIIMHELMHTTGFWHEHSRSDRDSYIEIIYNNIQTGRQVNFEQYDWNTIQSLGVSYDLGSIMHYGPYAFSKDKTKPTIIPRLRVEIGQRRSFSEKDITKINLLYECPGSIVNYNEKPCQNNHANCQVWAALGECKKNPKWMTLNCIRSCGKCGDPIPCEDKHRHCTGWASRGECKSNPNYMLVNCQRSCNNCL